MDEKLKRIILHLQIQYAVFIFFVLLLGISYEMEWLPTGLYAIDPRMQYILETVGILVTIAFVPFSLKLYSRVYTRYIQNAPLLKALKLYELWSSIRLLLLVVAVLLNIVVYYLTLDNIGGLCALIGITASLFCLPGENKMRKEMNIEETHEINLK